MDIYYVNTKSQDNGDHEVHKLSCSFMPLPEHRLFVGYFNNCHEALKEAKKTYPTADGCRYCCQECNTK
jgi:hypothetical protein